MNDTQKQVDAYMELPRNERREKFPELPRSLQRQVRKASEARRGIAYRLEGGVKVLTKEAYLEHILRMQHKKDVDFPRRLKNLNARLVELKRQVFEHYGEEALSEVEDALEQQAVDNREQ